MDIKWRKFSYSPVTKIIIFMIAILSFASAMSIFFNIMDSQSGDFEVGFEDSYFLGQEYMMDSSNILNKLTRLTVELKNEENILDGGALSERELTREEEQLYREFRYNSKSYNPNLIEEENYNKFKEIYAEKIQGIKEQLIQEDMKEYNSFLRELQEYKGLLFYASDGENEFTNNSNTKKEFYKAYPSYMIFDNLEQTKFPEDIKKNPYVNWLSSSFDKLEGQNNVLYVAFTDEFLIPRMENWKISKEYVNNGVYKITAFLLGFLTAFICLILVIGRKPSEDNKVHFNIIDRIYNDINLSICFTLVALWIGFMDLFLRNKYFELIFPITLIISSLGFILVLSLVKHLKNRSFFKHTLFFAIFNKFYKFLKDIYGSGSVGVKVVLIVIGYPAIVALTFFMFPVTIGIGIWIALKEIKKFNAIKEGMEKIKDGDIQHKIDIAGKGEFAKLANNINSITDGLKEAVNNEVKSERLKTELITNVSHDIRTPLTSIITYVDLLKNEKDQKLSEEYLKIIDQKAEKLKILTDNLFEVSKASSGNIPVEFEKIDIASLITQGLGELDDKIKEMKLQFKLNLPENKVYIKADGKLLWRVFENLLSNIFKYSLAGSRVYIDVEDLGTQIMISIKNISAYELNISSAELMERFKRGDESRTSQGSGLGLSIAKSLIDIQNGSFNIKIDGDLFKAIIKLPKY